MKLATDLQTALLYLMEAAEKEERRQDADSIVQVYRQMSQIAGLAHGPRITASFSWLCRGKTRFCAPKPGKHGFLPKGVLASLGSLSLPPHTSKENDLSRRLLDLLGEELEQGDDLAFLRNTPQYETLLGLWQQDNA